LINLHASIARACCDRIVGIAQGVVVFDGPPQALDGDALDRIYPFDRAATAEDRTPVERAKTCGALA
jgi:phosphonate transport system ATP-binding protein